MRAATRTHIVRKRGFTLVEIMIVVAIIGLLAAIAVPNFVRARNTTQRNACINNLRNIHAAKQQWALENRQPDSGTPSFDDVANYLKNNHFPRCPSTGYYIIGAANTDPLCSAGPFLGHILPEP